MTTDEFYIKRCIQIAKNGLGITRPNPMVGAIIVYKNKVIGEGYTDTYGGPHAEVNAVNSVKDKRQLQGSTMYVTLEPCSHFGKTPPCSDMIIRNKIPRVVIGCLDDNPKVAGRGVAKLRAAGCEVLVGVLEQECKIALKRFFTFHHKKRPYIILKWAETIDGFIAPSHRDTQQPVWISNTYSRQLVHKWRAEEQAILVGTNTIIEDNPNLTARDWTGQNPTRVVIDETTKLESSYTVFNDDAVTIRLDKETIDFNRPIVKQICTLLYSRDINSIIVEGGAKTLETFIKENLWDEARIFTDNTQFKNGIKAPKFQGTLVSEQHILEDTLRLYRNPKAAL